MLGGRSKIDLDSSKIIGIHPLDKRPLFSDVPTPPLDVLRDYAACPPPNSRPLAIPTHAIPRVCVGGPARVGGWGERPSRGPSLRYPHTPILAHSALLPPARPSSVRHRASVITPQLARPDHTRSHLPTLPTTPRPSHLPPGPPQRPSNRASLQRGWPPPDTPRPRAPDCPLNHRALGGCMYNRPPSRPPTTP